MVVVGDFVTAMDTAMGAARSRCSALAQLWTQKLNPFTMVSAW